MDVYLLPVHLWLVTKVYTMQTRAEARGPVMSLMDWIWWEAWITGGREAWSKGGGRPGVRGREAGSKGEGGRE